MRRAGKMQSRVRAERDQMADNGQKGRCQNAAGLQMASNGHQVDHGPGCAAPCLDGQGMMSLAEASDVVAKEQLQLKLDAHQDAAEPRLLLLNVCALAC